MEKSVHELITDLCEKHIDKRKCVIESIKIEPIIKKLRAKSFEILLKKPPTPGCFNELKNSSDPICHLLAWQYNLRYVFNNPERAEELNGFTNRLMSSDLLNDSTVKNVVLFLLCLRKSKADDEQKGSVHNIFHRVTLKHKTHKADTALPYDIFYDHQFKFTSPLTHSDLLTIHPNIFNKTPNLDMRLVKYKHSKPPDSSVMKYQSSFDFDGLTIRPNCDLTTKIQVINLNQDEGYDSPCGSYENHTDIWELAWKQPENEHRTWESLGTFDTGKELPFACESGGKTLHLLQKIIDVNNMRFKQMRVKILTSQEFVKKLKYMLVGMVSDIFATNENDMFYLCDGITVEGISVDALKSYCSDLIQCGSCYRALNQLCTPYPAKNKHRFGYIFKELCESVLSYLSYYKAATLSVSDSATILTVHTHMRQIQHQILALARVCKVAMFSTEVSKEEMKQNKLKENPRPHGVELLNYLYREISLTCDKNVTLVLYSVFYPCCQIYFSRFLQRWLFEGVLIDPYEEFFVKTDMISISSRARTYWTRSFALRPQCIPDFLVDLKTDILQCGKTMNLLKLCKPDASLHAHILTRAVPLISCCLTPEQSKNSQQEIECYYIEMATLCGPRISLYHKLRERYEENSEFLSLIERKRTLQLKKLELQRQYEAEEKAKQKRKLLEEMQEQIRLAKEYKEKEKQAELERDLKIEEQNAKMDELRSKLLKEEMQVMVRYYKDLIDAADLRRSSIVQRTQKSKCEEKFVTPTNSPQQTNSNTTPVNSDEKLTSDEFYDALEETVEQTPRKETCTDADTELNNQINETFLAARRNRAKVMNLEFGQTYQELPKKVQKIENTSHLSDAQRNKLKVLNSEFNIFHTYTPETIDTNINNLTIGTANNINLDITKTNLENNGNITKPGITITELPPNDKIKPCRNNLDLASPGYEDVMNLAYRKKLDLPSFETEITSMDSTPNTEIPMSIDSTPNTEIPMSSISEVPTPFTPNLSLCTNLILDSPYFNQDSALLTTNTAITDDGFRFPAPKTFIYENTTKLAFVGNKNILSITGNIPHSARPMRLKKEEVAKITDINLKLLLYQSVHIALEAQIKLVNNEILKYFIEDQHFFSHLHSLRSYYFLLDGEFGRHITNGLFIQLYQAKNPADLINCHILQNIINKALYASSKVHENSEQLSFIVKNMPERFDLSSADVLDCLSLSYRINWPLNILLPCDTIEKYDTVFRYLLKVHHVSWILQKIFRELKIAQKEPNVDENILIQSPQYHKLQLYRHIMTHFIQTLQNYTVSEIQSSWEELENNMKSVTTLDQLYTTHIVYVKTIIFRCLLNKKCIPVMHVIQEIFVVILKFYNYLRSRTWYLKYDDLYYTHPNFKKLEDIFYKFEEFTYFVFRVGNKMANVGYQPHLVQMLDMLNLNFYYTNKQKK